MDSHRQLLPNRSGHDWQHPYNPAGPTLGGDGCVDSSESVPEGLVACEAGLFLSLDCSSWRRLAVFSTGDTPTVTMVPDRPLYRSSPQRGFQAGRCILRRFINLADPIRPQSMAVFRTFLGILPVAAVRRRSSRRRIRVRHRRITTIQATTAARPHSTRIIPQAAGGFQTQRTSQDSIAIRDAHN